MTGESLAFPFSVCLAAHVSKYDGHAVSLW